MNDIQYCEKILKLLEGADRRHYHRLIHETKKRLAVSKKAKFDEGTKEIAQQMQREANETVKKLFGLETVDMQPHGCLAKFEKTPEKTNVEK